MITKEEELMQSKNLEQILKKLYSYKQLEMVTVMNRDQGRYGVIDDFGTICQDKLNDAKNEAKILSKCKHPNIIKYFNEFLILNNYFILKEKCEMSIQDYINKGYQTNRSLFISIALQILTVADYLHTKNLFLRDFSLGNILLDNNQNIKISDFGPAKEINCALATQEFLTSQKQEGFKYYPPEILEIVNSQNQQKIYHSIEGDIWVIGICLYLLAGATFNHVIQFTQGLEQYQTQYKIDPEIELIIKGILQRDPSQRPSISKISLDFLNSSDILNSKIKDQSLIEQGIEFFIKNMICYSITCFKRALEINPNDGKAHYILGNVYLQKLKLDEAAVECYKRAIEIIPDYYQAHNSLGIAYKQQNKLDVAITCFQRALAINPKIYQAHYQLGSTYQEKNMFDEAITYYKRALDINPNYDKAHFSLGASYYSKNILDEAISCYKRALQINPKREQTHYRLGRAYWENNMKDEATACYQRSLEINPINNKSLLNLGLAYQEKNMLDDSIATYKMALKIDPELVQAYFCLGIIYQQQNKLDKAIACYKRALQINSNYDMAYWKLGITYYDKNILDKAIRCFQRAIEINPNQVKYQNSLKKILKKL